MGTQTKTQQRQMIESAPDKSNLFWGVEISYPGQLEHRIASWPPRFIPVVPYVWADSRLLAEILAACIAVDGDRRNNYDLYLLDVAQLAHSYWYIFGAELPHVDAICVHCGQVERINYITASRGWWCEECKP